MNALQKAFEQLVTDKQAERGELPRRRLERVAMRMARKAGRATASSLIASAPEMLVQRASNEAAFMQRTYLRWRKAFDLLDAIWVSCEETGRSFNDYHRPQAVQNADHVFEALAYLNAKALLVSAEMICLMKGGFADGALARWRTIYELNVIATLLRQEGEHLAVRYLAHSRVQAWERIKHSVDVDELDTEDQKTKDAADAAMVRFGSDMRHLYGWACTITARERPTFSSIEQLVEHEHGRPIYKAASQHIHSNHRLSHELLGMSEATSKGLLVGASNSGMVTPLVLCGFSLVESTSMLILQHPNIDRSAIILALMRLARKMDRLAKRLERRTLRANRV
jgi:hypothetical protein